MIKLLIIALFIFPSFGISKIQDVEDPENFLALEVQDGANLIKSCIDGRCKFFPSDTAALIGFKGTDEQWDEYFQHCSQFSHLNHLTNSAKLITSLVSLKVLTSAQLLIKGSRILTGVAIGGLQTSGGQAYPDIDKFSARVAKNYYQGLGHKDELYYETKDALYIINEFFESCSFNFRDEFVRRELIKSQNRFYRR